MGKLEDVELAYLAGLIDGDGCLFMSFSPHTGGGKTLTVIPMLKINLNEREAWLLEELRVKYGGYLTRHKGVKAMEWGSENRRVLKSLLRKLLPYLRLKKKQAELMIRVLEIMEKAEPSKPRAREDILEIAKLSDEISDLASGRRGKRKWNYEKVKEWLASCPVYSNPNYYIETRREIGRKCGFRKGHRPWNRISEELELEIVKLRKKGQSYREIQRLLKVSSSTITRVVKSYGIR